MVDMPEISLASPQHEAVRSPSPEHQTSRTEFSIPSNFPEIVPELRHVGTLPKTDQVLAIIYAAASRREFSSVMRERLITKDRYAWQIHTENQLLAEFMASEKNTGQIFLSLIRDMLNQLKEKSDEGESKLLNRTFEASRSYNGGTLSLKFGIGSDLTLDNINWSLSHTTADKQTVSATFYKGKIALGQHHDHSKSQEALFISKALQYGYLTLAQLVDRAIGPGTQPKPDNVVDVGVKKEGGNQYMFAQESTNLLNVDQRVVTLLQQLIFTRRNEISSLTWQDLRLARGSEDWQTQPLATDKTT